MVIKYLALAIVFSAVQLGAAPIYSNLGPGESYQNAGFFASAGSNPFYEGTEFTATSSGDLSMVLVPVYSSAGPLTFGLYSDSSGAPGTLLESWTSVTVPTSYPDFPLTTLTSVLQPLLSAGSTYWFLESNVSGPESIGWDANDQSIAGGVWTGPSLTGLSQVSSGSSAAAIELDSGITATPEPTSWLMVAAGLTGLLYWRRRRSAPLDSRS